MKLLLSLPYLASTNNYLKYFPYPLDLYKLKKKEDELIDLNFKSYKKKKEEIYEILDEYIIIFNNSYYTEYIILCGNYAPDGDKYEFFEYFLKRINKKVKLIGPYCLFKKRIEHIKQQYNKDIEIGETHLNTFGIFIPDSEIIKYSIGDVKRVTMRVTNGCPRKCSMCPVPLMHNGRYKFEDIDKSVEIIKQYYEKGIRLITFIDDNIGVVHKKFIEFLTRLKKEKLKGMKYVSLEGFETYTLANMEICKLLKELHFQNIKVGLENVKEDFLRKINKYYDDHNVILNAMKNIQDINLDVTVYFLLGLDESEEDIMNNLTFIAKYHVGVRTNILRPYENSTLYKKGFKTKIPYKRLKYYSSLSYAVSWLGTNYKINLFDKHALKFLLDKAKLTLKLNDSNIIIEGKVWLGFKTSKLIVVLKYLLTKKYKNIKKISNDKTKIVFRILSEHNVIEELFK